MESSLQTNYNHVLMNLQDYMLTEKFIQKMLQNVTSINLIPNGNIIPKTNINTNIKTNFNLKPVKDFFLPKEKDTLFWCFYIMKNGEIKYEMLENTSFITEKKIKIEYVEKIRKEKQLIKMYKFATLTHIENQLANEHKIDIKTFLTLCVIEKLNVLLTHKKTFFELIMNDTEETHIICQLDHPIKYGYKGIDKNKLETYKNTLFKVDNIDKPIKPPASYKVQDLIDICNKLGIEYVNKDTNKNKNKNDLYESIIQYF